jgi:P27 family predicted phage terminase small subunit
MRGRKPTTVSAVANPISSVTAPPSYMSKEAKAEWRRVAPILIQERRTLTDADLATLENYCLATGAMRQAQRILNVEGLITAAGKRHPAFGIMNAAQTTQRLCAAELGLTPVSRSRPAVRNEGSVDDNPFGI